jgi:Na+(H+)/acetate symporter ActP
MPAPDEKTLLIFSRMFIFSALLVAGYVAIATKQTGVRRALLAALAFVISYSVFWLILRYEP